MKLKKDGDTLQLILNSGDVASLVASLVGQVAYIEILGADRGVPIHTIEVEGTKITLRVLSSAEYGRA